MKSHSIVAERMVLKADGSNPDNKWNLLQSIKRNIFVKFHKDPNCSLSFQVSMVTQDFFQ